MEDCEFLFVHISSISFISIRALRSADEPREIGRRETPVNALATHRRFIHTNGVVEFRRLVFGFIGVIRRAERTEDGRV